MFTNVLSERPTKVSSRATREASVKSWFLAQVGRVSSGVLTSIVMGRFGHLDNMCRRNSVTGPAVAADFTWLLGSR